MLCVGVSMLMSGPWVLVLLPFVLAANHTLDARREGARLDVLFGHAYQADRRNR